MVHPRALLLVAGAAAGVYVSLFVAVALHEGPLPLDGMVWDWTRAVSSQDTRDLVRPLARLGAREVLIPILLGTGVVLWWRRGTPGPLLLLVGSYLGMAMVVGPTKTILHRPEPLDVVGDVGRSFPSGHAAQAVLVYGLVAVLVCIGPVSGRVRAAATVLPVVACVTVGWVVLFRNAHWLSDMVGGYAVGLAWLTAPVGLARLRAPWLLGLPPAGAAERGRTRTTLSG